jgi:hypothetical protein
MKFYSIQHSLNPKIIGNYPQVQAVHHNCDVWDEPKFMEHVQFEKVDFEPITSNAILHKKSKQTDLIHCVTMGFSRKLLISGKLKTILEKNRKSGMQFFKSQIIQNNLAIEDYWILNMYDSNLNYIDYLNSNVFLQDGFNIVEKIGIQNFEEFLIKNSEILKIGYPMNIVIKNISILKSIENNFFLLKNVEGGHKYTVSENLKKEIEDAGCTGIEFQPTELSFNEWLIPGGEREKIYGKA